MLEKPNITTRPKDLKTFLKIDYKYNSKNDHTLKIPLLNKNESITIMYTAYSTKLIPSLDLKVHIHKKDLNIKQSDTELNFEEFLTKTEKKLTTRIFGILAFFSCLAFFIISFINYKRAKK